MKEHSIYKLYKRLTAYLKPYLPLYILCSLINGGALFLIFSSVGVLLREIMEISVGTGNTESLSRMLIYLVIVIGFGVISSFALLGFTYIEQKIQAKVRRKMINSYLHGEESTLEKFSPVEVLNRINSDLPACVQLVGYYMDGWIFAPILSGVFSVLLLFQVNSLVALLTFFCALLNVFVIQISSKQQQKQTQAVVKQNSKLLKFMQECINGRTEVRTFFLEMRFAQKQEKQIEELSSGKHMIGKYRAFRRAVVVLVGDCITIVSLLILGNILAEKGWIDFGDIMLALPLSDQINQMLVAFGNFRTILRVHEPHMQRVFEIVDLQQENTGRMTAGTNQKKQDLRLEDVSFSYKNRPVLEHVSMTIPFGKKVTFVGPSGCGKSTILKLLLGLYEPQEGEIYLGETPVKNMAKSEWRSCCSYYPQELSFFFMSVIENIAMGENVDQARIQEIMKSLDKAGFLEKTPKGYDTVLGQIQEGFSGGQLQRIALARCLYRRAPFLLLDEPISALDADNGNLVRQVLEQHGKEDTVIAVTHRLELIENFDWIFVIDKGKIAEQGTHSELLAQNGIYAEMWKNQAGEFLQRR